MDSQGADSIGPLFCECVDAGRSVGTVGVEETSAFEKFFGRLVRETVFEVGVVVLVGSRMNNYGVGDFGFLDECRVVFECGRFGLIGSLRVEGKFLCVGGEEVDVRVDEQRAGLSGEGERQSE